MRRSDEIVTEHTTEEDGTDLLSVLEAMDQEMGQAELTPIEAMDIVERHLTWGLQYVAQLALRIGAEAGVVPEALDENGHFDPDGFAGEVGTMLLAFKFDKARRVYDAMYHKRSPKGQLLIAKAQMPKGAIK